jgi:mono/diheme cytochrome c family protein
MMPYMAYSKLDREDIYSIIAYLRTLPSKEAGHRATEVDFPLNLIIRTLPADPAFEPRPDGSDEIAAGEYLVKAADCRSCHTVVDGQENLIGPHFAGGRIFDLPPIHGVIRSSNITPDSLTGIGAWTRETFIQVIRERGARANAITRVEAGEPNTVMPYGVFAGMTDGDLGAIYAYLRTLPPLSNAVQRWTPREM